MSKPTGNFRTKSEGSRVHVPPIRSHDIRNAAIELYREAEEAGVKVDADQVRSLVHTLKENTADETVVSDDGEVFGSYLHLCAAVNTANRIVDAPDPLSEVLRIRWELEQGAKNTSEGEQRAGGIMLKRFDAFFGRLSPLLMRAGVLFSPGE